MVFWTPYPWYFDTTYPWYIDPPTHDISNPLSMVFWTPYPWYFEPPTHGISNLLPMLFRPPYPWYFDPPAYLLIRNEGSQNTMTLFYFVIFILVGNLTITICTLLIFLSYVPLIRSVMWRFSGNLVITIVVLNLEMMALSYDLLDYVHFKGIMWLIFVMSYGPFLLTLHYIGWLLVGRQHTS